MKRLKSLKIFRPLPHLGHNISSFLIQDMDSGLVYSAYGESVHVAKKNLRKALNEAILQKNKK